jgi:CyaY protein
MNESEFNQRVDDTLAGLEQALEDCGADLDWDLSGGILTIVCPNRSAVIVNRQGPARQIWVAARSGGFHFDYDAATGQWRQQDLELYALLSQALTQQCGEAVALAPPA